MNDPTALSGWEGLDADEVSFLDGLERFARTELADAPWDLALLRRCGEIGLQALLHDEHGRLKESRLPVAVAASELLGSLAPAIALAVGASRIHSLVVGENGSPELRERWLDALLEGRAIGSMAISESEAGSDVRAISTTAHPTDDGWVLDGEKLWVTLGPVADLTIVLAKLGTRSRDSEMGMFVVERGWGGVSYGASESVDALSVPIGSLTLQDVLVPPTHVLAAPGGFRSILTAVNYARLEAACTGAGIQRAALRAAAAHAAQRHAFGVPIAQHQAVQLRLGRMATNLEATRSFLHRTAAAGFLDLSHARLAALKVFATDGAMAAASDLIDVLGAGGLYADHLPGTLLRGAKAAQIYDGTSDINLMTVGRAVARPPRHGDPAPPTTNNHHGRSS